MAAQVRTSNLLCCRGPSLQLAACSPGGSWRPGGTQQHFLLLDPFCSGALRLAVSATPHHFPPGAPAGGQLLVPYLAQAIYRRGLSLPTPLNITGCPQLAVSSGRPPSQIFLRLTPAFPTGNKKAVRAKACHTALPACPFAYRCNTLPARPACQPANIRTHPTAACAHHARQCQSAPPPRLRRRPRPVTLRRPPLPAVMLSTVVSALSASFRPLRVPSSLCLFPPAAVTQCIWSAWRSTARKPMVRRTCCARCVATADARSVYREGGPVCTTISCDRYVVVKACPCRSGSRAKPLCGKPSKTTNSGRLPPAMHPNPARRQGLPCCAATGSRPWDAQTESTSYGCRTARCSGRPCLSDATLA